MYFLYHFLSLLIFWAFYQVFLKKDTFFERNRYYLLLASLLAFVIPFLEISINQEVDFEQMPLPVKEVYVKLQDTDLEKPIPTVSANVLLHGEKLSASQGIDKYEIVKLIYFLGVAIALILFLIRIFKLLNVFKEYEFLTRIYDNKLVVRFGKRVPHQSDSHSCTFSFFNYLFWDSSQNLTREEEQQILEHELAHIRGGHSYDLIFMELQKVVFWFNPIIYLYEKELRNQHEFIADSRAKKLTKTENYISLMVSSLFKTLQIDLTHSFHNQQVKQRIAMLEEPETSKFRGNTKSLFAGLIIGMIVIGFACSKGLEKMAKEDSFLKAEKALMKEYLAESEEFEKKYTNMEMKYTYIDEYKYNSYFKMDILHRHIADIDIQGIPNEEERTRLRYILLELHKYWTRTNTERWEAGIKQQSDYEKQNGTFPKPEESWNSIISKVACFKNVDLSKTNNGWIGNKGHEKIRLFDFQGIVNEQGKMENIQITAGSDSKACDEEFIKILETIQWEPSIKNGKPQKQRFRMSIPFTPTVLTNK
jgi:beta-lactamase regulating signal transducer with metallopeptidase domain